MKNHIRFFLACVVAVSVLCSPLAAATTDSGQATLTAEVSSVTASIVTPNRAISGGIRFSFRGGSGSVKIGGASVAMMGMTSNSVAYIGMDVNGDGTVSKTRDEMQKVVKGRAAFKMKMPGSGEIFAVLVSNVSVAVYKGKTASVSGAISPAGARKGVINGVVIRLLDDNLNGKIGQGGKDAIAVGKSLAGLPLQEVHQIGVDHYKLSVAPDGSSVSFERLSGLELGLVKLRGASAFKCMVVSDGEKAYDLRAGGAAGIPAGAYKLIYGMVGSGSSVVTFLPTKTTPTYRIKAGNTNTPKIGMPLRIDFIASFAGRKVTVQPYGVRILGAGDELYQFQFGGKMGTPNVSLKAGTKTLSSQNMEYG
jgi:hypothetical protein